MPLIYGTMVVLTNPPPRLPPPCFPADLYHHVGPPLPPHVFLMGHPGEPLGSGPHLDPQSHPQPHQTSQALALTAAQHPPASYHQGGNLLLTFGIQNHVVDL